MLIFVIAVCDKKDVLEAEPIMLIFCAFKRWRKIARSFPLLPPPQPFPLYRPPPPPNIPIREMFGGGGVKFLVAPILLPKIVDITKHK